MPLDNEVYIREAEGWRNPHHFLSLLLPLTTPRVAYIQHVLYHKRVEPQATRVLDLGCGGGLVAEVMARLGYCVTGLDPATPSVHVAQLHSQQMGLPIRYLVGRGEALPFPDQSFDVVYGLDVLEHVDDLEEVIAQIARVLRAGGVFIYDTSNRTFLSWIVVIKLLQDCPWTRLLPRHFHDWHRFITPQELRVLLGRYHLEPHESVGFFPRGNPLLWIRLLRQYKQGCLSYEAVGQALAEKLHQSKYQGILYGGYAVKTSIEQPTEVG